MQFGYTIIYVNNVSATIEFYERAFGLEKAFIHESKQYAELATGSTKLAFASDALAHTNGLNIATNSPKKSPPGFEIALVSQDVYKDYNNACLNGASPIAAPIEKPWGQIVAYVKDLNGVIVEICSQIN